MSSELAALEKDLKDFSIQLEAVEASLQSDPDNAEFLSLKAEIEEGVLAIELLLSEIKPAAALLPKRSSPPAEKPKWSVENHPAYQAGYRKPSTPVVEQVKPIIYNVNDMVLAKWTTGDKGFYPARITSVTGSSADPVYYVTFKSYGNTETVRSGDIKPMPNDSKKRKADGIPVISGGTITGTPNNSGSSIAPAAAINPTVISAPANIDSRLADEAKKEPNRIGDGPSRPAKIPKKIKAKKELEAGKSKWQDFTTKGKFGKVAKKDSMFRTGESVTARVGFTGSGQVMRKDASRSRHVYQASDDDNY